MREILIKLRALLADPNHWVKRDYARRPDGTATWGGDPEANCFCILGAIEHLTPNDRGMYCHVRDLLSKLAGIFVPAFNDDFDTTHEDVLALIDRAIALS